MTERTIGTIIVITSVIRLISKIIITFESIFLIISSKENYYPSTLYYLSFLSIKNTILIFEVKDLKIWYKIIMIKN